MFKKIISILVVFTLILPIFDKASFIYAEDDEEETTEKSNYDKCIEDKDKEACKIVAKDKQNAIREIEDQIAAAQDDREAATQLAMEYSQKAESMQAEIDVLKAQIEELKARIEELEAQIAENEEKVSALNERVKNRMSEAQKTMHFNGYLEFILGSKSFTDMLRRVYGVNAILNKDQSDRTELIDIITQLNKDKDELNTAKAQLDESYEEVVEKQAALIAMQEFYEQEAVRISAEIDDLNNQLEDTEVSLPGLSEVLKELGITVNDGFVAAVKNSWISSTVWNYDNDFLSGAWHLGVDYAASRGTEIHAPAGGVILRANGGFADPGYLGSLAGDPILGGGNQVYMMCEVDGYVYGFIFFHMHSIYVDVGDLVMQNEVIGTVGSSGSSTGPHCHIEMYRLGRGELGEFLEMSWNATFSCGRGAVAYYYHRCEDGASSPCILNPEYYLPAN